jgi:hypothetical protein
MICMAIENILILKQKTLNNQYLIYFIFIYQFIVFNTKLLLANFIAFVFHMYSL